jgi:hypothetical protein
VVQHDCAFFAQDQNWKFKSTNEIVNQFYGDSACLDTTGNGTADHEHVELWICGGLLPALDLLGHYLAGSACGRSPQHARPLAGSATRA